jgi:adenylate cyclase
MREQRKLAAVLAADVVGYSRLMGRDEAGTLARLKEHRAQRLEPALARYGGRLVKLTGDGALAEFPSAVDALRAAIEFQRAVAEANEQQSQEQRIVFRIGLHIGDLIVDGDDLYGDGVNIAARLEGEAPPGGIVVSGALHEAAAGKLEAQFVDLGRLTLKNIDRQVQAYRVERSTGAGRGAVTASREGAPLALPDKPSIAVLPFQNMSGDPEQEYFVDGLVEDIITALSRFRQLFVIARNSSFTYKGKATDIKQIGRELGVRYVLEGSVRKTANRIRITGQLIDAVSGAHLWADKFDGALEDVFDVQDRVTASVVGVIAPRVEQAELERSRTKPAVNLRAYDLLLRAQALMRTGGRIEIEQGLGLLRQAVELDPANARAFANLAYCCWIYIVQGFAHRDHPLVADMAQAAQKALALDPVDAEVVAIAGWQLAVTEGGMEAGVALVEKAIALNPNDADAVRTGAILYGYRGEVEEAVELQRRADRLNPADAGWNGAMGYVTAYFGIGAHEKVLEWTARILSERPNAAAPLRYRAASLALVGRVEEARQTVSRILQQKPDFTVSEVRRHLEFNMNGPFKVQGVTESLYRGLRLAGVPE